MATTQEVRDACIQSDDIDDLELELTNLSNIIGGSGTIDFFIRRDGEVFNLSRLIAVLGINNANQDTMESNIQTILLALVGPDEVTQNTLRKELRDLVTLHEADVAGT